MPALQHFGRMSPEICIDLEQNSYSHGGWPLSSRSMVFFRELCFGRSPSVSVSQPGENACCVEENRRNIVPSKSLSGVHCSYTTPVVLLLEERVQLLKIIHSRPKTPEFVDKICDIYLMVYYCFNHCWLWRFTSNEVKGDILYLLFELGLKKYLIGNMTTLFIDETSQIRNRQFRDTIQAASNLAQRNQLPAHLQDQLLAHSFLKFRIDYLEGLRQQETLDSFPKAIRSRISHYFFYSLVENVYLFRGVSNDILFQLISEMKAEYFPPKSDVLVQNETPLEIYILVSGAVDLLVLENGVETVVGEAKIGDLCGEICMLSHRTQQFFTFRAKRLSQLLKLECIPFLKILEANVGETNIIMKNFLQHLKELNDPIMEDVMLRTKCMLRCGTLPISLYNRRLADPNQQDLSDGRTVLHLAASLGYDDSVLILLKNDADPNIRDFDGSVPLWEAMLGGHESTSEILVKNGANLQNGDVGQFACIAAEKNSLNLLKDIMRYGGDITLPNITSGATALHVAVSQGNVDIVKLLMDLGADIDKPDMHGLTARALADIHGHVEIKALFGSTGKPKAHSLLSTPEKQYIERFRSKIIILLLLILITICLTKLLL